MRGGILKTGGITTWNTVYYLSDNYWFKFPAYRIYFVTKQLKIFVIQIYLIRIRWRQIDNLFVLFHFLTKQICIYFQIITRKY